MAAGEFRLSGDDQREHDIRDLLSGAERALLGGQELFQQFGHERAADGASRRTGRIQRGLQIRERRFPDLDLVFNQLLGGCGLPSKRSGHRSATYGFDVAVLADNGGI
jgi:hypothetical protein